MKLKYYSESGIKLRYGTKHAAGLDLPFYDPELGQVSIEPGERVALKTGIYCEFPEGYFGFLDSRSSTSKLKIDLLARTIDGDFIGNIKLTVTNVGKKPVVVTQGEYLIQMLILERQEVEPEMVSSPSELSSSGRGTREFGSTGGSQVANGEVE